MQALLLKLPAVINQKMTKQKDAYRWSDPDVILILSRDFLEEEVETGGEMTDEFFEELKIEMREKLWLFLQDCYKAVEKKVPNGLVG
ncbi:MAG: hypothetical protein K2X74_07985 [Acetobacteraceae bacterium]|nr:hypothetical protein [Acetobacteraceae bacterium]